MFNNIVFKNLYCNNSDIRPTGMVAYIIIKLSNNYKYNIKNKNNYVTVDTEICKQFFY